MKTRIVGLTGGIACGKSSVIKEFRHLGTKIIDADKIAHDIIKPGTNVYKKILKSFGHDILTNKMKANKLTTTIKRINRKKLGEMVFNSKKKRKTLEKITHPVIIGEIKKEVIRLKSKNKLIIIDAPLLFEAKLNSWVDKTIVIWLPQKMQIERLKKRDNLTYCQAKQRINSQIQLGLKKKMADYIIDNSKPFTNVRSQIKTLHTFL